MLVGTWFRSHINFLASLLNDMLFLQCEREYHVGCLKENGMEDLKVRISWHNIPFYNRQFSGWNFNTRVNYY